MYSYLSCDNCVNILRTKHHIEFGFVDWRMTQFSLVQSLSDVQLFATSWTAVYQASLCFTISQFSQIHVHWVGDAIQPSHPLSSPSPLAFNLSQYQSFFQWVSFSHQVAKVLEFQFQHQSFQWIFRVDFLYDWLVWSPCCPITKSLCYPPETNTTL